MSTTISDSAASSRIRRFGLLGLTTIITIYLLILLGGIVRATGAGMGCPDWPTCFGSWIPPTDESQLPANYQEIYAEHGYADTTFNVVKTWTEYVNRLMGVFTGIMILLTLVASYRLRLKDAGVFRYALAAFLLVAFQGWLGAQVVATNLNPVVVTLHMIVAQIIVLLLIYGIARSQREFLAQQSSRLPSWTGKALIVLMVISILQLVLGTQVREAVDLIALDNNFENRHLWIENLPAIFSLHRLVAIPIVVLNALLLFMLFTRSESAPTHYMAAVALTIVLTGTVVMGMAMDRMHLPVFAQPLHLFLASLILGIQFFIFSAYRFFTQSLQQAQSIHPQKVTGAG